MTGKINISLFFCFLASLFFSQEDTIVPLTRNRNLFLKKNSGLSQAASKISSVNSLNLPFFDDFSGQSHYVDPNKWMPDSSTFRNDGYPRAPFTVGAVTFDGLNKHGYPYSPLSTANGTPADTLTSRPIDMSIVPVGDTSVFLSFFYQTRGWGDPPESSDSLVLEYYSKDSAKWYHAWGKSGFNKGVNDSSWKFVILPITHPQYFKDTFQFRFHNYATVSGAFDHWHVDYIYLNVGRTKKDSCFKDIAFGYEAPSLLKDYSAMPWWQFDASSSWAGNHPVFVRNNDTTTAFTNFMVDMRIYDTTSPLHIIDSYLGGASNIPNYKSGWDTYAPHCNPPLSGLGTSTVLDQPISFFSQHYITTNDFSLDNNQNDTLKGQHNFWNYYAFDDGTAEGGYQFAPNDYGAEMCVKIVLNKADTLKAVDIYWDPVGSVPSISNSTYRLKIWGDAGGLPQASGYLYQDSAKSPIYYPHDSLNIFTRDTLTTPFPMVAGGTYYIGIQQSANQSLNVGFDKNYDHNSQMFYNVTGAWAHPSFKGSYMIRPVMRALDAFAGIKTQVKEVYSVNVYPNPAKTNFTVNHSGIREGQLVKAELYDFYGRLVISEMILNNQVFDVSSIANGIYFLKISDNKTISHTTKLFVAH